MSWSSPAEGHRWQPLPDGRAASSDNQTVLDFTEAMHTFRSMFPNLEEDVIEQVLRSHGGAVDSTIDSLLKISTTDQPSSKSHGGGSSHRTYKTLSSNASANNTVEDVSDSLVHLSFTDDLSTRTRWRPAMLRPLPSDFLSISGFQSSFPQPDNTVSSQMLRDLNSDTLSRRLRENEELRANAATAGMEDGDLQAFLEDERIAIMLQNEEFVRMLSQDEDFMEAMRREQSNSKFVPPGSSLPIDHPYYHESRQEELTKLPDIGAFPYTATASRNLATEEASTAGGHRRIGPDMTKHMGHSTKVKLAKLAKKFFGRKGIGSKKSTGHGLPHLSHDSKAQGALSSAGQAPLLDDDELADSSNSHNHGTVPNEYQTGGPGSYGRF